MVLVFKLRPLGDLSLINVSWGWEYSGGPKSWTQVSYFGSSGPVPYCSVKTSQASQHRRQNPMTNGERNTQQPRTLKQTCALTKRREKKGKKVKMGVKKEESNQECKNRKKDFI